MKLLIPSFSHNILNLLIYFLNVDSVILDRTSGLSDDFWKSVDYTVFDNKSDLPQYRPKTPPEPSEAQWTNSDSENAVESLPNTLIIDVENLEGCGNLNSFHASDDEQSCSGDTRNERCSTGGKRGSADEALAASEDVTCKNEEVLEESCKSEESSVKVNSERVQVARTRTDQTVEKFNEEGCVSWFRSVRNCVRHDGTNGDAGQRNHYYDRRRTDNNLSFNSISDLNRPGKHFFRRNYRIGGFKNINFRRKRKDQERVKQEVFTTSEISLPDLFADSSVNLIPELETSDDSFAILDKLGLDDDFIKKEPEISLDVDGADKSDVLIKSDTGQNLSDTSSNTFQKQRLKLDKNIFEFSETDFLKYETDCDADDLLPEIVQNDVVGCCGLFGLTPNSRFNLVVPTYLPLESDKPEGDQLEETVETNEEKPTEPKKPFGTISNITSDIENQQITLQLNRNSTNAPANILTSRLNIKNDFPSGYPLSNSDNLRVQPQQQQTMNDIYALNHHNYTISGPPGYGFKQSGTENTQTQGMEANANSTSGNYNQNIANLLTGQNRSQQKTNRAPSTTLGFTKLSALSGARITHNLGHTTINHDPSGTAIMREQPKVVVNNAAVIGLGDSVARNLKHEEIVKTSNHDGEGPF